jgi:XamI restriction endonuclease
MIKLPRIWSSEELAADVAQAVTKFRAERLATSDAWESQYKSARVKFEALFATLENLTPEGLTDAKLAEAYGKGLGDALRYLAGPPISDDDLSVIAGVDSIAPGVLKKDAASLRKVFEVIEQFIDPHRFPWLQDGTGPSPTQREAALLASSVLLAAQRIATERRNDGKAAQESKVKDYLTSIGFTEVPAKPIKTLVGGPQDMQFCGECVLAERKADVVVRLHDTRLLAIECKVSNSGTNSVKRLNNDAAVKAGLWNKQVGDTQMVPAALLAGVFKLLNLEQAQQRGLFLFWSHDLDKLGEFIESTRI